MSGEGQESYLVARIGRNERLLELCHVREIVPAMQLTHPEGVGGVCRGIANVRGDVVPVFDLDARDGELDPMQMIVIARAEPFLTIGILVDDVLDLVHFAAGRVVSHPAGRGRYARTVNVRGATLSVLTPKDVLDAA
jgi:chemotaxis signal transduction protein